jgi:hypothetical protein
MSGGPGAGGDRLVGRAGNDTYIVNAGANTLAEAANGGTDAVLSKIANNSLSASFEDLTYIGTGNFRGNGNWLANTITAAAETIRSLAMAAATA